MSKERPILFSPAMVRAILAGAKTQTRRVVTVRESQQVSLVNAAPQIDDEGRPYLLCNLIDDIGVEWLYCPHGQPGDRLWCRETWASIKRGAPYLAFDNNSPAGIYQIDPTPGCEILYRATDDDGLSAQGFTWRPSMFMPRWASRILLELVSVRVERLQDMPWQDVAKEGVGAYTVARGVLADNPPDPRWAYIKLWNELNEKRGYGWDVNPWVWCLSFERIAP